MPVAQGQSPSQRRRQRVRQPHSLWSRACRSGLVHGKSPSCSVSGEEWVGRDHEAQCFRSRDVVGSGEAKPVFEAEEAARHRAVRVDLLQQARARALRLRVRRRRIRETPSASRLDSQPARRGEACERVGPPTVVLDHELEARNAKPLVAEPGRGPKYSSIRRSTSLVGRKRTGRPSIASTRTGSRPCSPADWYACSSCTANPMSRTPTTPHDR